MSSTTVDFDRRPFKPAVSTVVEYTVGMPSKAREGRDGKATRAAILDIARSQFGDHGFERTTIRSIASEAGVDPALVMHYFGSKAGLFAAAARLQGAFPHPSPVSSGVAPERLADVLVPLFVKVWDPQGSFLPLLRAAATNRAAADALLEVA